MTWEQQQEVLIKLSNSFLPKVAKVITSMYKDGLLLYQQGRMSEIDNKFFDAELMAVLITIYERSGVVMARYVYKTMPKVKELQTKAALGQMGISAEWLNAVRNNLGRYALEFVTDITGTIRQDMIDAFQQAIAEGWSYEQLANYLLRSGLAIRRARVISRTETHRGAMQGSIEGARSLRYEVQKQWVSGTDMRVRRNPKAVFDHRELNGQTVELDQPFMNEEAIMVPGDPKASPGNTIQCRCVLNYIPKRDARGRLILKK